MIALLSFIAATFACVIAWHWTEWHAARVWRWLSFVYLLFVIEVIFGFRYGVHDFFEAIVDSSILRTDRVAVQISGVAATAIVAVALSAVFLIRNREIGVPTRVAGILTFALGALFAAEIASPTVVDTVIYRRIGPISVIGLIRAIGAAGVILASFWDLRSTVIRR